MNTDFAIDFPADSTSDTVPPGTVFGVPIDVINDLNVNALAWYSAVTGKPIAGPVSAITAGPASARSPVATFFASSPTVAWVAIGAIAVVALVLVLRK